MNRPFWNSFEELQRTLIQTEQDEQNSLETSDKNCIFTMLQWHYVHWKYGLLELSCKSYAFIEKAQEAKANIMDF